MHPNPAGADDHPGRNIEAILEFDAREEQKISRSQRMMDPARVLAALDERGAANEPPLPAAEAADAPSGNP